VEGLLGAAYVVCQTQINAVMQIALRVPDRAITFPGGDKEVRALDPQFDGEFSKIELLWALANYYKHQDEWTRDTWDDPKPHQKRTVLVIKAAGLSFGSSGNLRTGAEALGNASYNDTGVFSQIIRVWSTNVRRHVRGKVGR
jgi:hypothetical protein